MCVHGVAILSVHLSVTRGVVVPERNEVLFRQIFLNWNGAVANIMFITAGTLIVQRSGISGQAAARSIMTYLKCQSLSEKSLKLTNCCHQLSDFKAKNERNWISAGAPPLQDPAGGA